MLRSSTHRSINLAIIQHIGNYIYMPLRNLFDDTILTYYLNINIRTTIIYIKGLKLYMPLGSHFDGAILTCYLYVDIRITIIYIKVWKDRILLGHTPPSHYSYCSSDLLCMSSFCGVLLTNRKRRGLTCFSLSLASAHLMTPSASP